MKMRGQTDLNVPSNHRKDNQNSAIVYEPGLTPRESLVCCPERESQRPDCDIRRNCLTSIIWMPVHESPIMRLSFLLSDTVLYWQGGLRVQYHIYCPLKNTFEVKILGPDIANGEMLQIPVPGGVWKGALLLADSANPETDFCLVGESVAPGFDFYDFHFVTEEMLGSVPDVHHRMQLERFLHRNLSEVSGREVSHAESFYEKELQK